MIKFIVTSTSGVSKEYVEKNDISVVRLCTDLDGVIREEGYENEWNDFYEALKQTKSCPKTSLPSPDAFLEQYKTAKKDDKIIMLTISKSLSGTYNAALIARDLYEYPENVFVIDSTQCSITENILLEELVDLKNQGKTAEEIVELSKEITSKLKIQFVPSTMEYLRRGGRIGLLSGTIANVLSIKPILAFNDGKLVNTKKCLGMGKAIDEMIKAVTNPKKIIVGYIHESDFLQQLIDRVNKAFGMAIATAKKISPVVGCHIGIGAVGIASIEV